MTSADAPTALPPRPPLDRDRLADAPGPWTVEVVEASESTNTDLAARATSLPAGSVLVAEHQTAGLGRLGRAWEAPARSGLTFSILVRPDVDTAQWGWLSLLAGVALREAVAEVLPDDTVALKWPNDLLLGQTEKKAAGILAQVSGDAVIIGIGVNVSTTAAELPVPTATSIELTGGVTLSQSTVDRTTLLLRILDRFAHWYDGWVSAGGNAQASGLAAQYQSSCGTLGRRVRVAGVAGDDLVGTAARVDAEGRLTLIQVDGREPAEEVFVAVGDVLHLRPEAG